MPLKPKTPQRLPNGVESLDDVARRHFLQKKHESTEEATTAKRVAQPDDGNDDGDEPGKHTDGPDADALIDELTGDNEPNDDESEGDPKLMPGSIDGRVAPGSVIERVAPATDVSYYAPITRIDKETREVIGVATAEVKDAYRTVIGYEASKDAFARWRGNIREMHDPKKAVGRALEITPDDAQRRIVVRAKISKGAEDTWQKVLDGTLTGFSIGGRNGKWTQRVIGGEELPYLDRYDQVELSLVDNPACPVAAIEVVRADGMASDILATESEMEPLKQKNARNPGGDSAEASVERAGARLSKETQDAMHSARDHALNAAKQTMQTCGCDDCMDKMNKVAENDDNDGDMDPATRAAIADIVRAAIAESMRTQVAPVISRVNALLAHDAQRSDDEPGAEITRRVDDVSVQIAAIKALVEQIAAQPTDGGPVLHGGGGVAMDKHLATQGSAAQRGTDAEAIRRAMELGFGPPTDPNAQILAASKLIQPIRR